MFHKILIANRGEIACRIIRSAKRLGIKTLAVYSQADAQALHVKQADEAYLLGPAPSQESYLNSEKIIQIALDSKAQAIHPGYGFLAENASFAEKCQQANICFIGPSPENIRAMGEKDTAKRIMEKAKIPTVPGYLGENQMPEALQKEADTIGYPVLIKAIAGGGGKGMRIVHSAKEFENALNSAKREAKASFGDDRVFLEKYLAKPRHIEVQVFADTFGHTLYLFERDCSIQRRHQKIIEEALAPHLKESLRKKIGETAVKAAQAIHYQGAGTMEFLLDQNDQFYFMEMNTRLQVEHPITEMITGLDLVEWQIRIAAKEKLPMAQNDLKHSGHAIEARICAEDPYKSFMPSIGRLWHLKTPAETPNIRIDSGVTQGDSISLYYDSLIAKLIAWDKDRHSALARLKQALTEFQVLGVTTNIPLLISIIEHPDFIQEKISTDFVPSHQEELLHPPSTSPKPILIAAGLALLLLEKQQANDYAQMSSDPSSPWFARNNWRLNASPMQELHFWDHEKLISIKANQEADAYELELENIKFHVQGQLADGKLTAYFDAQSIQADIVQQDQDLHIFAKGQIYHFVLSSAKNLHAQQVESASHIIAPMPGTIVNIAINPGQKVNKGDSLMVVEAMKMEHTLYAPADGVVKEIFYKVGDLINEGVELLKFEVVET